MQCKTCNVVKLSHEFPPGGTLGGAASKCSHLCSDCLRCAVTKLQSTGACHECKTQISKERIDELTAAVSLKVARSVVPLSRVAAPVVHGGDDNKEVKTEATGLVTLVMMDGKTLTLNGNLEHTVLTLKAAAAQKLGPAIEAGKLRLLYNKTELLDGATLASCNATFPLTLLLQIRVLSISDNLKRIRFDLNWGYPAAGRDYLDGTCLLWMQDRSFSVVDYKHKQKSGVQHSGDIMTDTQGHHNMEVDFDALKSVYALVFCLSAWNAPTIGNFPNPSVTLFDATDPSKKALASVNFQAVAGSQAAIMCFCCRTASGRWEVQRLPQAVLSSGNAKNYGPIKATISSMNIL